MSILTNFIEQKKNQINEGRLSSLPICCISFYVGLWSSVNEVVRSIDVSGLNQVKKCSHWLYFAFEKLLDDIHGIKEVRDYIPCPICVLRGRRSSVDTKATSNVSV